ncbi:DNA gyrase inhibitor YacG [Pseudophaeobacter sp. TrK17]|uniref:DNA gyrase inhibitor YacG n=1 Tax=Pseudophaeobacter sp. TrK17 TaxID=2815167 RepID=UPI0035CFC71B
MSCPICGLATKQAHRPFCSKRCANLDLANWMNGSYAVPSNDPEDIENAMKEAEDPELNTANTPPTQH